MSQEPHNDFVGNVEGKDHTNEPKNFAIFSHASYLFTLS